MIALRIKNLRGFTDTNEILLRDINLFVGQNSSGKSTFLRTFPLIRQSIIRETRGPILWYDDTLVDFGSYEEAKKRYSSKDEGISFGFKLHINSPIHRYFYAERLRLKKDTVANIEIEIFEKNKENYIENVIIKIEDQIIEITASHDGSVKSFRVNGVNMLFPDSSHLFRKTSTTGIIPSYLIFNKSNNKYITKEYFLIKCKEKIKSIIGNRLKNEHRIDKIVNDTIIGSKDTILHSLKRQNSIATWSKKIVGWDIENPNFIELNNIIIAHNTASLLTTIDSDLRSYFIECKYIAPIRAKALRYHRRQDLSISEVDANGDNLHMFLDNLNLKQKESYQEFVKSIFGFTALTDSSLGHITINVINSIGEKYNLTDLGFGYSQILPIITKLWYAFSNNDIKYKQFDNKSKLVTILIEQPELHLHPSMQAQLADAFIVAIQMAKKNDVNLRLIIETHSTVIINRIGRRIVEDKISSNSVNVTLFELDNEEKNSIVRTTEFNDNGVLKNWPLGFFEPKN